MRFRRIDLDDYVHAMVSDWNEEHGGNLRIFTSRPVLNRLLSKSKLDPQPDSGSELEEVGIFVAYAHVCVLLNLEWQMACQPMQRDALFKHRAYVPTNASSLHMFQFATCR